MNKNGSDLFFPRRWACVFALLPAAIFGGFYFFSVSAQTETDAKTVGQNLVLGRLLFIRSHSNISSGYFTFNTANADGSGESGLKESPSIYNPDWSPDGTKIIYSIGNEGLRVMNANGGGDAPFPNTPTNAFDPSWSANGKIAFEHSSPGIWTINADGTGLAAFPGIAEGSRAPVWSPGGDRLAYLNGGDIWTVNADGTNARRVTNTSAIESDQRWSPDGAKIIFVRNGNGIHVVNADGTNEAALALDGSQPSWSPDGTKIAFTKSGEDFAGIYLMDVAGANQVRIIANTRTTGSIFTTVSSPIWQPVAQTPNTFSVTGRVTHNGSGVGGVTVNLSGTTNAAATTDAFGNYQFSDLPAGGGYRVSPSFVRHYFAPANRSFGNLSSNQTADFEVGGVCAGGKCVKNGKIAFVYDNEILTVNANGTEQVNITNNPAQDQQPSWSPDGAHIVFSTNRDGNREIYRMDANGSNPVRLTNNPAADAAPSYSPDGASIIFVSTRDGSDGDIYRIDADGSNPVRLTVNASVGSVPAFSPDGRQIIFYDPSGIRLKTIDADGSNPQVIPNTSGGVFGYERPAFTPDGSKIFFTVTSSPQSQYPSIWTMNRDGTNRTQLAGAARSGALSPDGRRTAFICCFDPFLSPPRVWVTNTTQVVTPSVTSADFPAWQTLPAPRRTESDFDGDGRADLAVFRPSDGLWYQMRSSSGFVAQQWGLADDRLVPADYDGDLKTDVAVWRPSNGNFYILNSFDYTVRVENLGLAGDVPTGGDWDGDGKADPAVYRDGAQSTFYYRGSTGNPLGHITFVAWGQKGDRPAAGDFDGDGVTDAAVYRAGVWWIRRSSDNQASAVQFGLPNDRLAPADFDGDGRTDLAVFRDGTWYLWRSGQGFAAFQFGTGGDVAAPADYDGDGRADAAVYRKGVWWIFNSRSSTAQAVPFGAGGDVPVAAAFVR